MTQSSLLVGLLAAAFVLYVAARGRLGVYAATLWGGAPSGPTGAGGFSGGAGGTPGSLATSSLTPQDQAVNAAVTSAGV